MSITSIKRDWGVSPSGVRISATDSLATVAGANYILGQASVIYALNGGPFGFVEGDMVFVSASDGSEVFNFAGNDFSTLIPSQTSSTGDATAAQVQQAAFNTGVDSGSVNAYVVNLSPAVTALTNGLLVSFTPGADNTTTTPTLKVNGTAAKTIEKTSGVLASGDMKTSAISYLIYSVAAGKFILLNPATVAAAGVTSAQVQQAAFNTGTDTGVADAYIVNLTPAITALTDGLIVMFAPANVNTLTSPTLTINAHTAGITLWDGSAVSAGDLNGSFNTAIVVYSAASTSFMLLNPVTSIANTYAVQANTYNAGVDTGIVDAYVVTTVLNSVSGSFSPSDGAIVCFIPLNTNTGTVTATVAVNGNAPLNIFLPNSSSLLAGDLNSAVPAYLFYSNGNYILLNPQNSFIAPADLQGNVWIHGIDNANTDTYTWRSLKTSTDDFNLASGSLITFLATNTNTGPSTLTTSTGTHAITTIAGAALVGGEISSGATNLLYYNGSSWLIMSNSAGVTSGQVQAEIFNTLNPSLDAANTYSASATPPLSAGYPNTIWFANFTFGNSSATPTLNIDSQGALPITFDKGPLLPGDLGFTDGVQMLVFNGSSFELLNPRISGSTKATQQSTYNHGSDTGAVNAYAVDLSPAVAAYTDGLEVSFTPANNSTSTTPTLALNGLAAITIALSTGAVSSGALSTSTISKCIYSAAANKFILLTSAV